ncbi:hypothetical protein CHINAEXTREME_07815 [Halobiforma lacisalsi AJ5]|uniref:Uncharacterized protein n=1 Tax=Natronobacterium lacisalsi AJ5 TaxID=358396 RepID=M0LTZ8_NATLA|nr:hypothetical protein [Halobiforma lacisalsi]APW97684.1 hypothetical protein CHINAEXTREME_07815 [Halobiforma lacisalsi AJ5]EMA36926.1 hypothetical protein C445_01751 [Halobiforma lacisalsi AJ5]
MSHSHDRIDGGDRRELSVDVVLSMAVGRLRTIPEVFVPFVVAGIVLTVVDALRRYDPVPTLERDVARENGLSIDLAYAGYPTGVAGTKTPLESLVGLHPEYLTWGLALYLLSLLVVVLAGVVTMARAMDRDVGLATVGSVFGYVLAVDFLQRGLGSIDALQGMGLWGLPLLVLYLAVAVRLFVVPGLLVAGRGPKRALLESVRRTRGHGWTVFGVILVVGLTGWALGSLPGGTFATTAVLAPVHAVAVVVLLEHSTVVD